MNIKELFRKKVADKIAQLRTESYKPKFKKGDVIFNSKYKIFRRVEDIDYRSNMCERGKCAVYICKDLKNDLTKYKDMHKFKECIKIDGYYELADPKMVMILFGEKK